MAGLGRRLAGRGRLFANRGSALGVGGKRVVIMNFAAALAHVLEHEGGFVDDPDDPGGQTKHGISIRFAGSIALDIDGDGDTDGEDIRALTPEYAANIYREHFWDKCKCDALPPALAFLVFDTGVNQGPRVAVTILQHAIGVKTDGSIGPITLKAAHDHDADAAVRDFIAWRSYWYARTQNVNKYGLGWYRRVADAHAIALNEIRKG